MLVSHPEIDQNHLNASPRFNSHLPQRGSSWSNRLRKNSFAVKATASGVRARWRQAGKVRIGVRDPRSNRPRR